MNKICDIAVLILFVAAIAVNVALPPDIDVCQDGNSVAASDMTVRGGISVLPQTVRHRNNGNSGAASDHCRVQLPFAAAVPAASFEIDDILGPSRQMPRGISNTMNDHPTAPLTGPPRRIS